ncbi:MAG: TIM barrel protein [Pseudomonadota bacterium]
MRTSIATVCLAGTLEEKATAIAKAGFDGLEIFEPDLIADHRTPREAGEMIRAHGLTVDLFQPFRDLEGLEGADRTRAFDRLERKFDLMGELGCGLMLICSSVHPRGRGGIDRMAADIAEAGERAAARGLKVGYEALAWGAHIDDHRDAWEVVRRADHPAAGVILDSFHTLGRGLDPDTIRAIPGDRIAFVQLADAPRIPMDLFYWSRHFRSMPGEGDLDVAAFMRAVGATGYDGPVSLEVFNDLFRGGLPGDVAVDGHRSLVALMDDVRRTEKPTRLQPQALPRRASVEAVEFIEFAVGRTGAPSLQALLRTMGLRHVGDHRTKRIALWQSGAARIVLNADPHGFAETAHAAHGVSVCDVGLRVPNADDAVVRARALGASPFEQPLDAGQVDIPAIRGVGGGVVHLIDPTRGLDSVWDIEFDGTGAPEGDLRIDHVAETTTYDRMLSWGAAYAAVFDLWRTPIVDVSDPDGLIRSMALAAPDRTFRLTVNGADTHRTLAGHFLADSFHSAVQHIAFATDDLFALAERLKDHGFDPLPIPGNYYSDVSARLGLSTEFCDRLRDAKLMFDRDETGGEFLQLYSRPTEEGLFFEFVERRGGYDGYGAPNAPFRIAAQKRLLRPKGMPRV